MNSAPVFYSNLPDDLHCMQACIKMVCEAMGHPVSWEETDRMTGFEKGLYTWAPRTMVELDALFPGTKLWSDFDYVRWFNEGEAYLFEYYHGDAAYVQDQKAHATPGFEKETRNAKEMLERDVFVQKYPALDDWKTLVKTHYIIAFVHFGVLHSVDNNTGHAVLVYGIEDDHVLLHDPGLPPIEAARIPIERFLKASRFGAIMVPRN